MLQVVPRYLGAEELASYVGLGKARARDIGAMAGARIKFGKRVLYDREAVDRYMESLRV